MRDQSDFMRGVNETFGQSGDRKLRPSDCIRSQESTQQAIFGQARRKLGEIFHALARQKECQILEGHLLPDHVHMCIAIPPKYPVASVIGFLKGKSAIAMARLCGKERNFTGEHFWARGYAVSTVGFELEQVRKYIREQESADGNSGGF